MIIRAASDDDSFDVYLWRNNLVSRAMSVSTDKVSWLDHNNWFNASIANKKKFLYIGTAGDLKVGVSRFDVNEMVNKAEVSINLNPRARGRNLSHDFLWTSMRRFFQDFSTVQLVATIRQDNVASLKCFTSCGFIFTHSNTGFLFLEFTPEEG